MTRIRWLLAGMIAGAFGLYSWQTFDRAYRQTLELEAMARETALRLAGMDVRIPTWAADITRDSGSAWRPPERRP